MHDLLPAPATALGYRKILSPTCGVRISPLCLGASPPSGPISLSHFGREPDISRCHVPRPKIRRSVKLGPVTEARGRAYDGSVHRQRCTAQSRRGKHLRSLTSSSRLEGRLPLLLSRDRFADIFRRNYIDTVSSAPRASCGHG